MVLFPLSLVGLESSFHSALSLFSWRVYVNKHNLFCQALIDVAYLFDYNYNKKNEFIQNWG